MLIINGFKDKKIEIPQREINIKKSPNSPFLKGNSPKLKNSSSMTSIKKEKAGEKSKDRKGASKSPPKTKREKKTKSALKKEKAQIQINDKIAGRNQISRTLLDKSPD